MCRCRRPRCRRTFLLFCRPKGFCGCGCSANCIARTNRRPLTGRRCPEWLKSCKTGLGSKRMIPSAGRLRASYRRDYWSRWSKRFTLAKAGLGSSTRPRVKGRIFRGAGIAPLAIDRCASRRRHYLVLTMRLAPVRRVAGLAGALDWTSVEPCLIRHSVCGVG